MALKPTFYINGERVNEPLNYQELSIELSFDKDDPSYRGQVSTNSWEFGLGDGSSTKDAARIINDHLQNGLSGGDGIFSPPIFEIKLDYNNIQQDLFKGYLDMPNATYLCDRINANAIEFDSVDWLNEKADISYEYLYNIGVIRQSDFVLIPYQINQQRHKYEVAILLLTGFNIAIEIINLTQSIIALIKSVAASGLWDNIFVALTLLLRLIALIIQVIFFFTQLFKYVLEDIRYKAGMFLHDLCRIGCNYLGLEFSSTILNGTVGGINGVDFSKVVLIPNDFNQFEDSKYGTLGVFDKRQNSELRGVYRGTIGDLFRELKTMFNAKIIINDGTLQLERVDYSQNTNPYIIPNIDRSNSPVRYNTDKLSANYSISFTPDTNDLNVYQEYQGTELKVITSPLNVTTQSINVFGATVQVPIPAQNNLLKGEVSNVIGFTLCSVKTDLTKSEKVLSEFIGIYFRAISVPFVLMRAAAIGINAVIDRINDVIRALNRLGVTNAAFISRINLENIRNPFQEFLDRFTERRTRIMMMETHFIDKPRLITLDISYKNADVYRLGQSNPQAAKVSVQNRNLLNANHLWNKFHLVNSFIEDSNEINFLGATIPNTLEQVNNQKKIYELENIPFCIDDYNKVKNNSQIVDSDGVTKGEIVSLKWNVYEQKASITFNVKEKYTNNLKLTKISSNGR